MVDDETSLEIMIQHLHVDQLLAIVNDRDEVRRMAADEAGDPEIGSRPTMRSAVGYVDADVCKIEAA